jgi:hypothetical protein
VPINARVIGTHEHESHCVFDLPFNNTSDIKPERHSTPHEDRPGQVVKPLPAVPASVAAAFLCRWFLPRLPILLDAQPRQWIPPGQRLRLTSS